MGQAESSRKTAALLENNDYDITDLIDIDSASDEAYSEKCQLQKAIRRIVVFTRSRNSDQLLTFENNEVGHKLDQRKFNKRTTAESHIQGSSN